MAMGVPGGDDVTTLLAAWRDGAPEAEGRLIGAVYAQLRRIAAGYLRRERPGHTLQPTALVNEAYLRLVGQRELAWQDRGHLLAIASREMRRILVDHARKRRAAKREGLVGERVTLAEAADPAVAENVDILSLHEALTELATLDPRQAELVDSRYFGGLTIEELAQMAGVSPATVKRELTTATVWLRQRLATQSTP
jgi:RNA polymerase sigma-70 factor (ECF subfamily)